MATETGVVFGVFPSGGGGSEAVHEHDVRRFGKRQESVFGLRIVQSEARKGFDTEPVAEGGEVEPETEGEVLIPASDQVLADLVVEMTNPPIVG